MVYYLREWMLTNGHGRADSSRCTGPAVLRVSNSHKLGFIRMSNFNSITYAADRGWGTGQGAGQGVGQGRGG